MNYSMQPMLIDLVSFSACLGPILLSFFYFKQWPNSVDQASDQVWAQILVSLDIGREEIEIEKLEKN